MTLRNYSSTAAETTLSAGVDASSTTLTVSATTGFPSVPFILAVDAGAAAQELVLVTNVAGSTLTVTRAYDSTVASPHDTGAAVAHSHGAIDFREANTHVNATTSVHGVSGALVGATTTQALSNKDLTSGTNTFPTSLVTLSGAQTLTNKTLTDPVLNGMVWPTYTPTWTATGGGVSIGNGSLTGRYITIGKTVHFYIALFIGTTTSVASGRWDFTLPAAAIGYSPLGHLLGVGNARKAGVRVYHVDTMFVDANKVCGWRDLGDTEATVTPTTPFTFAAGDSLTLAGTYEAS